MTDTLRPGDRLQASNESSAHIVKLVDGEWALPWCEPDDRAFFADPSRDGAPRRAHAGMATCVACRVASGERGEESPRKVMPVQTKEAIAAHRALSVASARERLALGGLSPAQREVLELRVAHPDASNGELGRMAGCDSGTWASRVARALKAPASEAHREAS